MDTTKFYDKENIKMIAHRGVSGLERENTLPAFLEACKRSYYGIETDVRATKDGKFLLFHDPHLRRTFGREDRVIDCDFGALRALRFYEGETPREDLFIPTPEEYFALCKEYDKEAIFELKPPLDEGQVRSLVQLVQRCGWIERTTFISFEKAYLLQIKKYYPAAKLAYLADTCSPETVRFMQENGIHADLCALCLSKALVDELHAKGIKVNCWTVDRLEDARLLKEMGVDYITSNILE